MTWKPAVGSSCLKGHVMGRNETIQRTMPTAPGGAGALIGLLLVVLAVRAADDSHRSMTALDRREHDVQGADYSGADLSHSDFSGANCQRVNFSGADLTMSHFTGADLRGAIFTNARIDRITLDDADLRGVIGWPTTDIGLGITANRTNFSGVDLREWRCEGTYFEAASFSDADLTGATLVGRFNGALFDRATVTNATMLGVAQSESLQHSLSERGAFATAEDFAEIARSGHDFSGHYLHGAQLQGVDLSGARLRRADLHSANLQQAHLHSADLQDAKFYWANLKQAQFDGAKLTEATLDGAECAEASFDGAQLTNASLRSADLRNASLRSANLSGVDLTGADLTDADLTGADLAGANIQIAILDGVRGIPTQQLQAMRQESGRAWHESVTLMRSLLEVCAIPLHVALTVTCCGMACWWWRNNPSSVLFKALATTNLLAVMPWVIGIVFTIRGGSPTAQMSDIRMWMVWLELWPTMMMGLVVLTSIAVVVSGLYTLRVVWHRPRVRPFLSIACALLTPVNCALGIAALFQTVPDA